MSSLFSIKIGFTTWDNILLTTFLMLVTFHFVLSRTFSFCRGLYSFYDRKKSENLYSVFNLWNKSLETQGINVSANGLFAEKKGHKVYLMIENHALYREFRTYYAKYDLPGGRIFNEYFGMTISDIVETVKNRAFVKTKIKNAASSVLSLCKITEAPNLQSFCLCASVLGFLLTFFNHITTLSLSSTSCIHYLYAVPIVYFLYSMLIRDSQEMKIAFTSKKIRKILFYTALFFISVNLIFVYQMRGLNLSSGYKTIQMILNRNLYDWGVINSIIIFISCLSIMAVTSLESRRLKHAFNLYSLPLVSSVFLFCLLPIELFWGKLFSGMPFILFISEKGITSMYINYMAEIYRYASDGIFFNIVRLMFALSILGMFSSVFIFIKGIAVKICRSIFESFARLLEFVKHYLKWVVKTLVSLKKRAVNFFSLGLLGMISAAYFYFVKQLFDFFYNLFASEE